MVCNLELGTSNLTMLVSTLWVAGGKNPSQRHQNEQGALTGLSDHTKAKDSQIQELGILCGTISLLDPRLRSALLFWFLPVAETWPRVTWPSCPCRLCSGEALIGSLRVPAALREAHTRGEQQLSRAKAAAAGEGERSAEP